MMFPKNKPWRSEKHRRLISTMDCAICGRHGPSQCAHVNFGKAMASKADDSLTFPACPSCHRDHDQGGHMGKQARWLREWEFVDATRAELIRRNQWAKETEEQYQSAIVPLAHAVHPEPETA